MNINPTMIELDADHQVWNNELSDMKEEISDFERALGDLKITNNVEKEHFQNLFKIHRNAIDDIKNKIQKCHIHNQAEDNNYYAKVNEQKNNYHQTIAQKVNRQSELYENLKQEFDAFRKLLEH